MEKLYKETAIAYVKYTPYGRLIQNSLTIANALPEDTKEMMYRQVPLYVDSENFVPLPSVQICRKTWTTQNLDVTTYRNGDAIPYISDPTEWANATTGAWCYPHNDPALGAIYGKLYNHYAVTDPRKLAPDGWHIPAKEEWVTLVRCTSGIFSANIQGTTIYDVTGAALKEVGTAHWADPNVATNSTGFTAFGPGYRNSDGGFDGGSNYGTQIGPAIYPNLPPYQNCAFWMKEAYPSGVGLHEPVGGSANLFHATNKIYLSAAPEKYGLSVRLVKDQI